MPKWACFSQFAAHFTNPFTVCGQMASQLLAVFISSFAVILQCVQKGHVDKFMSQVAFKKSGSFDLNSIGEFPVGPNFKISPTEEKKNSCFKKFNRTMSFCSYPVWLMAFVKWAPATILSWSGSSSVIKNSSPFSWRMAYVACGSFTTLASIFGI